MIEDEARSLVEGRGSASRFERVLALRERSVGSSLRSSASSRLRWRSRPRRRTGATSSSPGSTSARGRGRHDDRRALRAHRPLYASGARVVVSPPDPDRIVASVTPRTRLLALSHVLWTTEQLLPVHEPGRRPGPILVDGAQSVGTIPVDARGSTTTRSRARSGSAGLKAPAPSSSPSPTLSGGPAQLPLPTGLRVGRRFRAEVGGSALRAEPDPERRPRRPARGARTQPAWRFERAGATAERLRELLRESGADVVVPEERATLVSWRVPAGRVGLRRRATRRLRRRRPRPPGRGLVRASVGWWTSDDDLERLVAAL